MISTAWRGMALSIGLCVAAVASAQDKTTTPEKTAVPEKANDDILVTAQKPLDSATARHFVAHISSPVQDQLARFHTPVCPQVIGLPEAAARFFLDRLRQDALLARAEVDKPKCQANLVVVFIDDPSGFVRALRSRNSALVEDMQPEEMRRLINSHDPVRVWNVSIVTNERGERPATPPGGTPVDPPKLEVQSVSNFRPSSQQMIGSATLVFDQQATIGKSLGQLADYAAMRTLARTRPPSDTGVDTILTLFDPASNPPHALTTTDRAYLAALYRMPGNDALTTQRSVLASAIKKATRAP